VRHGVEDLQKLKKRGTLASVWLKERGIVLEEIPRKDTWEEGTSHEMERDRILSNIEETTGPISE